MQFIFNKIQIIFKSKIYVTIFFNKYTLFNDIISQYKSKT